MVNPLHAAHPGSPQQPSPYYPSSRLYRSPLYLRIEDVPGAAAVLGPRLEELAAAGRALNDDRRIDRDAVWRLKHEALTTIWDSVADNFAFDRWRDDAGEAMQSYATFCVLAEQFGRDWREWPDKYRHPGNPDVVRFGKIQRRRVRFHQWVQWLVDRQLATASSAVPVMHDMALGVDPAGADAWMWQDVFALGMSVGAPPDEFNTRGQDWGVPPFNPWALRAVGYRPFVETIRAALCHAGGLRLDHVMGLFRQWWVPAGGSSARRRLRQVPGQRPARHRRPGVPAGRRLRRRRGPRHRGGRGADRAAGPRRAVLQGPVVRGPAARRSTRCRRWRR